MQTVLYHRRQSLSSTLVLIATELAGIAATDLAIVAIESSDVGANVRLHLPVVTDSSDLVNIPISHPIAIAQYLCEGTASLGGSTANSADRSAILQWMFFARDHIHHLVCSHVLGGRETHVEKERMLHGIDTVLQSKTFLVGESLTLADVFVAVELLPLCRHDKDVIPRRAYPHLVRWLNTCLSHKTFQAVLGKPRLLA